MSKRRALFLDRDGVVNFDSGYTHKWDPSIIMPGIVDLIIKFKKTGFLVIIVTNQSGIGRKYFSDNQFNHFMIKLKSYLAERSASIDDFFYCSCNPLEKICFNRKPNPGLLLTAIEKYNIDPALSYMVGDKITDIEAAASAKVRNRFLFKLNSTREIVSNKQMGYVCVSDLSDVEVMSIEN